MLFLLEPVSSDQFDRIFFVKTKILMMLIRLTLLSNFRRNLFALACTYEASSMSLWDNAEKNHLFTVEDNRFSTKICYGYKKQVQTAFFRNKGLLGCACVKIKKSILSNIIL